MVARGAGGRGGHTFRFQRPGELSPGAGPARAPGWEGVGSLLQSLGYEVRAGVQGS